MKLQFILGGAGAGKTGYILDDIVCVAEKQQNDKIIYIVPEQFSLQSEKNLISRLKRNDGQVAGAALKVQVLSFRRLAYHVFSEIGGGEYFDDVGKTMLLRKLIYERRKELRFFTRAVDKQGFMKQLAAMVGEFYQYGVTTEKLIDWSKNTPRASLRDKLSDLALIYTDYTDYVQSRYIPTDAMLDSLAARMDRSALVRGAAVWISGFHGFTPQEYGVLSGLIKNSAQVTVALTLRLEGTATDEHRGRPSVSFASQRTVPCVHLPLTISDPFFETKRTYNKLMKIADACGAQITDSVFLDGSGIHTAKELTFFEQNFFARVPKRYPEVPEYISIYRADDRYSEIQEAASIITELVRGGYSYGDIAVLTGDVNAYGHDIRNIFDLYEIPVFIDVKAQLPTHPLVEMILAMLDIFARGWSYESVFRFLKTGMTELVHDDIDILENYVLAYGIKGSRWAQERWEYGFDNETYNADDIHRLKTYVYDAMEPLKKSGKRTVLEISTAVFHILERLKVTETLDRQTAELALRGEQELVRRNRQIWQKVCEVFHVLVGILGEERISVQEFAKILESGFGATDMGIIPTSQIQVLAGDIERSRLPAVKALFVLGANDGVLPAIGEAPSLLDDSERQQLDPKSENLAPGGRRRAYDQQFLIYQALATPTERLFMSYPIGGIDGRAMRPSSFIAKMKKLYPKLAERRADYPGRVTLAKPMFSQMGDLLRETQENRLSVFPLPQVYGWFAQSEEYAHKLETIQNILFEEIGNEYLNAVSAEQLYGCDFSLNVSKLERYVECPFAYFIRHNLGALERRIYEAHALELGNLYHDTLALFTDKQAGRNWRELNEDEIDRVVDECIAEIAPKLGSEVLFSTARYRYVQKQAARVLKRSIWALAEHIKRGAFEIFEEELGFGVGEPVREVVLTLANGRRLMLHGRIDRVDIMDFDGKRYVKIIDYKSGNNQFDLKEVYFGTQLQLLLYMDAFIRSGAEAKTLPGGVFYFNLNDPTVDYDEKTLEQLDAEILHRFKMSGLVLADTDIIQALDSEAGRSSKIIPAAITAKGEAGGSSVATLDEFNDLRTQVVKKIKQLGDQMSEGNINIFPYKKGMTTGCTYCRYGAVCRFQNERFNYV